ncbi:signal peptidase I [Cellulomonas sp. zg-ZUI188]|uniref:Signal peptidase I n=1 Tax=Cellulomonas fengjieae TaxID=2819978 RepID=A0ABS3SCB7_9CELL|nr:signal peptidase I [Cellulomonas fengjieae]MBO3101861.1 signal peptidase I [Cellulomonas fengjieae]QVI67990.1 signal peptidase I [Cellulomonas fengjieae]
MLDVALWTVVVVCGLAYATSLAVPLWFQLHQQRLLIVTSGSMAPKFDAGDAVVLRAISEESDLKVGQIISFWPIGSDDLVTHRIVALRKLPDLRQDETTGRMVAQLDANGEQRTKSYVVTKGDANAEADVNATPVGRVRGVQLAVHKGWGWVLQWAGSAQGRAVMLVPPLLALATLELLSIGDARRARRARPAAETADRRMDELLLD